MNWYQYLSLIALGICFCALFLHFIKLIRLGNPKDLSQKSGNVPKAEVYSFTGAMLPTKKESAYLHVFSFCAGIFFHLGTFAGIILFFTFFIINPCDIFQWLKMPLAIALFFCAICGFSLFVKRLFVKRLRCLSHLDDFLSNFLTTVFQLFTIAFLLLGTPFAPFYYVAVSLLLLYMPLGKLRHVVYFFAARYHLGLFYGWRNTWPPQKIKKDGKID